MKKNAPLILGRTLLSKMKLVQSLRSHIYIIGGSRVGKTFLLLWLIVQDILAGRSVGVMDVHGDLINDVLRFIRCTFRDDREKRQRVILLDPTIMPFAFNPLEVRPGQDLYPIVLELISIFKALWHDSWGARMEDLMRNSFIVLAELGLTLCELPRLLTNQTYRNYLLRNVTNPAAKEYFQSRFNSLTAKTRNEWCESTLNKVSAFTTDPYIRAVLENPQSSINFREIIDRPGSVLLIRLPKGILKENAFLLGALLNSKIQEAALSRTDIPLQQRERFHLYVDEVQNFGGTSLNFQEILSESGKYGLSMTCAHQNTEQINEDFLASLLANCDCQISFRISRLDADIIAKEIFKIDVHDLEFERSEGIVKHTLEEKWEEAKNTLTQQRKREMCAVIKGRHSTQLKTITVPSYEVSDRQLESQAEALMASYRPSQTTDSATTESDLEPMPQLQAHIPQHTNPTEF